jgi:tetratricopeptide (TPR) repeat protein
LDYDQLAVILHKQNKLPDAEKLYQAAIALRKQLMKEFPNDDLLRGDLAKSLTNLAMLTVDLGKLPEAKQLMEQAITNNRAALALAPKDAGYRNNLARNHTHLADILVRLKDHAAAAKAAAEVLKVAPAGWQEYHRAALFTCQAIPLATNDDKLTDAQRKDAVAAHAAQAVQLLHQAVRQGYTDAAALKREAAFAPLRERADFQKLVSKLDGKTP